VIHQTDSRLVIIEIEIIGQKLADVYIIKSAISYITGMYRFSIAFSIGCRFSLP